MGRKGRGLLGRTWVCAGGDSVLHGARERYSYEHAHIQRIRAIVWRRERRLNHGCALGGGALGIQVAHMDLESGGSGKDGSSVEALVELI